MSDKPAVAAKTLTRLSAETRRKHIAEAALRALQSHGHSGLTARKVAAEAGLSLGHLTYHYKVHPEQCFHAASAVR